MKKEKKRSIPTTVHVYAGKKKESLDDHPAGRRTVGGREKKGKAKSRCHIEDVRSGDERKEEAGGN